MDPFQMGPLAGMLGGLQQKMQDLREVAAQEAVEGQAAGGLVRVVATLDQRVQSVHISQEAYEDRELLEDLVRAATNEALRKGKAEMATKMKSMTGGLPIPPGLIPGL